VFNPVQGQETYTGSKDGMQNPDVHFIFSGAYWTSAQGKVDEAAMLTSAKNILSGSYLNGLTQYGASGTAVYAGSWEEPSTVPNGQPSTNDLTDLQNFLQNSIAKHGAAPGVNDPAHAPIYVVIADPNSSAGTNGGFTNGGFNHPGTYSQLRYGPWGRYHVNENMHMIWLGTNTPKFSGVWKDGYTGALSHELVETISDPNFALNFTGPNGKHDQVGDFEPIPDNQPHYGYRLGGNLVQPYWSKNDNAFIVPDGNAQKFYLNPIWSGGSFNGKYDLSIRGDQLGANYSDNIRVDGFANGSSQVTMNKEAVAFDKNAIRNINIDTGGGGNSVRVAGVAADVTLNIDSYGYQSNDEVIVGSGGSLTGIRGAVNVSNTSGQTTLVIDASGDGPQHVVISDQAVNFQGLANINYQGSRSPGRGVTELIVEDGRGANAVEVDSVPALTQMYVFGSGNDWLYGLAASQVNFLRLH
jgi:hypothetical protein